jgi:hypothetical protein
MFDLYNTLKTCTNEQKYSNALNEINLKLTNSMLDNQVNISAFDFLCHLCNIWLQNRICYDNTSQYSEIIGADIASKKKFLNQYKHAPEIVVEGGINKEFLLINEIIKSLEYEDSTIVADYQELIDKCSKKANENIRAIIDVIIDENKSYTEQIQRLFKQWEEQIVYGGEENDD